MSTSTESTSHVGSLVSKFTLNDPKAQNVDKNTSSTSKTKLIETIPQANIYTMPWQPTTTFTAKDAQNKTYQSNPKNPGKISH